MYAVARTRPYESRGRVVYPTEITPQLLAFGDRGERSAWLWIEDRNQIGAWSRFLAQHVKGNRPELVTTRGLGESLRHGIHAPGPWPPRKDGSWSSDDPETLMTADDNEAFANEGQR
jgi:hypothetical protein